MLKKSLAILALAAGGFLGIPTAAYAVAPYPPAGPCASVVGTAAPDTTVTVTFNDGCFAPGEQYDVTVTGSGAITLDGVAAASLSKTASPTGGGTLMVMFPHDATAAYLVNAVGVTSQRACSVTMDVVPASPAVVTPSVPGASTPRASSPLTSSPLTSTSLASSGYDLPVVALWSTGGLVLLGAVMMIARARRTPPGVKRLV
jgi:hypothetical protein